MSLAGAARQRLRTHTTKALRSAMRQVQIEWGISRRHHRSLKRATAFAQSSPLKLNLGCAAHVKPEWVNIDLYDPAADLHLDLREPWPFPDESVSHIYSEHVFEHFRFCDQVPHVLAESFRVLKSGGRFDVGVPDSEWPLRAYGNPIEPYWSLVERWHPKSCETQLDHINYHFRQDGEHEYAWDEETLARSLRRAGFARVQRRQFDSALDSESRRIGTLYMRATKPSENDSSVPPQELSTL
jgi:predicted SAM-dependent methyltransferase